MIQLQQQKTHTECCVAMYIFVPVLHFKHVLALTRASIVQYVREDVAEVMFLLLIDSKGKEETPNLNNVNIVTCAPSNEQSDHGWVPLLLICKLSAFFYMVL